MAFRQCAILQVMEVTTLLNVLSTIALVGALIFAGLQVRASNRARTEQAAISLINTAQSEAWTRALGLIFRIPADATAEDIDALGPDIVRAVEEIGIRLETIGYMVYRRIATLEMVNDMIGGVTIFWWTRIRPFAERDRARTNNPKSYEWVQWLAERLIEWRALHGSEPAYVRFANWR
jgi:hypothetical protein